MPLPALFLDECVDQRLAAVLRALGYDVVTVQEAQREGEEDEEQLLYATSQGRMFLSHNQIDFRRWHARARRMGRPHGGIVLIPQTVPFWRLEIRAADAGLGRLGIRLAVAAVCLDGATATPDPWVPHARRARVRRA